MRRSRSPARVAAFLATLLASTAGARADGTTALADYLDGDAAVAMRLDFAELEEAVELYRTSNRPGAAQTIFLTSAAATAWLGFDPLTRGGWIAGGFDPTAPILLSVAAIDEQAATARVRGRTDPLLWRNRIVARVDDPTRAATTLRKLADLVPDLHVVSNPGDPALERSVGAARNPLTLVSTLRRFRILVAGRLPWLDLLVFARIDQDTLIVDLFAGFAAPARWDTHHKAIVALLGRRPAPALSPRLGYGAATRLAAPGTTVWIDPHRLLFAREALRLGAAIAARGRDPGAPPRPALCSDFDAIAEAGPFTDLAWRVHIVPRQKGSGPRIAATMTWGLRSAYRLAATLLVEDDGLLDPSRAVTDHGAAAAATVRLRNLDALRRLPRPKLLERSHDEIVLAVDQCGSAAAAVLLGFGWPQLIAAKLDDIAGIHAEAATLVGALRNSAFALQKIGPGLSGLFAVAEASFEPAASPLIERYLQVVFGEDHHQEIDSHPYTTWGQGPIRPYRWQRGSHPVFGGGIGGYTTPPERRPRARKTTQKPPAVEWYLALGRPNPRAHPAIAELVADPARILGQLATSPNPTIADAARRLIPWAATVTRFEASLELSGGLLEATSLWHLQ